MKGRAKVLLIGGLGGMLVGVIGAYLYLRSIGATGAVQGDDRSDPAPLAPMNLFRLGLSIVGILRQIAALGRAAPS